MRVLSELEALPATFLPQTPGTSPPQAVCPDRWLRNVHTILAKGCCELAEAAPTLLKGMPVPFVRHLELVEGLGSEIAPSSVSGPGAGSSGVRS